MRENYKKGISVQERERKKRIARGEIQRREGEQEVGESGISERKCMT